MHDDSHADRLDSWKAIARYLNKSVRTARRWEAEEGLPVHRQMHKSQGSVYAYRSEIDAWRRGMERRAPKAPGGVTPAAASTATSAPERSIAVLPFKYLGGTPESAYIADGFTEEIISALSRIRPLRVISWTSSMAFRDSPKSAPEIGRELGVEQLVEGSVRHEGARIRVAARLVDAATDDRVWSHSYDGSLSELFSIQDNIAAEVVDFLNLVYPAAADGGHSESGTNIVAWQFLVQARQAALRWQKSSIDQAVRLLRDGLVEAGDDARLYAALGRTYLHYREAGIDPGERPLEQAEVCAGKASTLQPRLAAGLQLRGWIHYARGDIAAAVSDLGKALEQEPGDPDTLSMLANCYLISGRIAESRPLIEKLCAIDPMTPLTRCMPGWAALLEGDFESAVAPYSDMFAMDPDNPLARLFYVFVLAGAGRNDDASEIAAGAPAAINHTLPGRIIALFGSALAGQAPAPLSANDAQALKSGTDLLPRFAAQAYALGGDAKRATEWMSVALDKGFINYPYLAEHDPFLASLAGTPDYDELLARARERWESFGS